jgi:DNA polymerase III delta prime subunit
LIAKKEGMEIEDKKLIAIAKESNGDLRKAINMLQGGTEESDISAKFDGLTIDKIAKLSRDERILLAFSGDPEQIFGKLWDMVQKEKAWDKLEQCAACNHKMNMSIHKTMFIAYLLDKNFG